MFLLDSKLSRRLCEGFGLRGLAAGLLGGQRTLSPILTHAKLLLSFFNTVESDTLPREARELDIDFFVGLSSPLPGASVCLPERRL